MSKRTIYIGNPRYLSTRYEQLIIRDKQEEIASIPIEDIGQLVLDHPQITLTQACIQKAEEKGVAIVFCDEKHLPSALLMTLSSNTLTSERFRLQWEMQDRFAGRLWQQVIKAKLKNQGKLIELVQGNPQPYLYLAKQVKSGDPDNREAQGASRYFRELIDSDFKRFREGEPPNELFNFGYAILRSMVARAICISGLLPTRGIHHHNRYNHLPLADDLMEPFRPFVDALVWEICEDEGSKMYLDKENKERLLRLPQFDCILNKEHSTVEVSVQAVCDQFRQVLEEKRKTLLYPTFCHDLFQ